MKEKLLQFVPVETLKKIPKQKLIKIIVIVGIVAIFGIFMSENFGTVHSKQNESEASESVDLQAYEKQVEERLTAILSEIAGVGSCKVMVTLDSSQESVYSAESESQSQSGDKSASASQKSKYVIVNDDGEKPILEKEIEPKIRGVIVVCEGAENAEVRESVIACIRAGLGITSANISVVRGGNHEK
ncbi:MAG: hypothetical protein IJI67_05620 [Clostridia bacterium]|nr:hypothetical protein [Clostridia bacterium]